MKIGEATEYYQNCDSKSIASRLCLDISRCLVIVDRFRSGRPLQYLSTVQCMKSVRSAFLCTLYHQNVAQLSLWSKIFFLEEKGSFSLTIRWMTQGLGFLSRNRYKTLVSNGNSAANPVTPQTTQALSRPSYLGSQIFSWIFNTRIIWYFSPKLQCWVAGTSKWLN